MGRITDAAIAVFVIIIGFFMLDRLGISLPVLEHAIRQFFFPSSGTTGNTTSSIILPLMMTNSRVREKIRRKVEYFHRMVRVRAMEMENHEYRQGKR